MDFKNDSKVWLYFLAVLSGFALIFLSDENVGEFFSELFKYVGIIAAAVFSFVIIFFGIFSFFRNN
ncbi:hypothetical protein LCL89_13595 [Halobacillus yeomjeoni]|uniref:Uncharacterized protein n=1 Tax=Halobacillus yeomjeoni TaxID=311194 RepID=A0A931HYB1_9BACI|nr:hypothetical protein [Halobacillus yeomjeoni]MBH0231606.1 hypothetical protein [Halobacillus yeomjeoni]MCA0985073.1 hypothetical protein [Halobacillus yeomjeoni]